ncbi:MAG TPA: ParB/RepB/Spo0J family partition protein [Candidatus Saccharimonadales bacterium]|jgi:ParB family chromosome partitioning protein
MALGKMGKMTGLGKGFDSLLPQNFDTSILLTDDDRIQKVAIAKVVPNANQPRTHFDDELLAQLADSIKRYGILQPLVVTPLGSGEYSIIAGERRWRASQLAGLETVPVIVRTTKELEQLEIALIENVQRVDLSPMEQAVSIERLHQQFNMNYDKIAERLGKAPSTINNTVRLLQLPAPAREALQDKQVSEGHARAILALKKQPELQAELLQLILAEGWSVRQAERFVTSHKDGVKDKKSVKARVETETPQTKQLSKYIGAPVAIRRTAKGGRLEVSFASDDELDRLIELLEKLRSE